MSDTNKRKGTWSIGKPPILEALGRALAALRDGLLDQDTWTSVDVDYEPPRVERLWHPFEEGRIFLHRLHPCGEGAPLFHPHPWPSAVLLLEGEYAMDLGKGEGMEPPPVLEVEVFGPGQSYAMPDRDTWHAVRPRVVTLSIMVTGAPWGRWAPKPPHPLRPLAAEAARALREDVRRALREYRIGGP